MKVLQPNDMSFFKQMKRYTQTIHVDLKARPGYDVSNLKYHISNCTHPYIVCSSTLVASSMNMACSLWHYKFTAIGSHAMLKIIGPRVQTADYPDHRVHYSLL